jgi:hypothetical protein
MLGIEALDTNPVVDTSFYPVLSGQLSKFWARPNSVTLELFIHELTEIVVLVLAQRVGSGTSTITTFSIPTTTNSTSNMGTLPDNIQNRSFGSLVGALLFLDLLQ